MGLPNTGWSPSPLSSGSSYPLEGSTSLALPPYLGWEANGSAGPTNGYAVARHDLLHVGVHSATPEFRGWFLTTTGSVPDACAFQFDADSPPAVPASSRGADGELVMAVQTSSTASSGDINYVLVAEVVYANGERFLQAGYSTGHEANALEHVLKRVPWAPGPIQVSIETNGRDTLEVWVDGRPFLDATGLDMGIEPPFQPYLEVQALRTPYVVAFSRYAQRLRERCGRVRAASRRDCLPRRTDGRRIRWSSHLLCRPQCAPSHRATPGRAPRRISDLRDAVGALREPHLLAWPALPIRDRWLIEGPLVSYIVCDGISEARAQESKSVRSSCQEWTGRTR